MKPVDEINLLKNSEFYVAQAEHFQNKEAWDEMRVACRMALEVQPHDWRIQALMGDALCGLNRWEEAISAYQKSLQENPEAALNYHKLAIASARLGRLEEADQSYGLLIERDPHFEQKHSDDFSVQRQFGDFFFRRNDWTKAIEAYQRAIKIRPESCWEHINLGRSFHQMDRPDEAIAALKKAFTIQSHNGWACYHLAEILYKQDQLEQAIEFCQKAVLLLPNHAACKNLMAQINSKKSHAEEKFSHATPANPADSIVEALPGWRESYDRGKQLQLQGKLEEAVQAYHQAIVQNPLHSWSYHDLGDTQLKLNHWHEAIAAYRQALKLNPNYFWSNYNLGIAYRNIQDWQSTVQLYRHAVDLNPAMGLPVQALHETLRNWYDQLMQEGRRHLRSNKTKALELFRQAIQVYKENIHIPTFDLPREQRQSPRVLLVVDAHLTQCLRYRVKQKVEQLEQAGFSPEWYPWEKVKDAKNQLAFFDVVIFYRVPAFPDVIQTILYAKAIKKVVFYEIDDLIFDAELFPDPIESYGGQVSEEEYDGLVQGTVLFQEAMRLCDLAIASTPPLLKQMETIVGVGNCYLHHNALDHHNFESLKLASPKLQRDYVSIFYGSGTKAHNSDFDELVAPALAKLLQEYPNVRLTLMGYLTLPALLEPFQGRIDRVGLVGDVQVYYEFLRQADIAIAVLQPTEVNHCKSELKWFEAATFKVPCVVSNTEVYLDVVKSGQDGLVAGNPEEWFQHLKALVRDESLRMRMGELAYQRVMKEYDVPVMAENLSRVITAGLERGRIAGDLLVRSRRKKLLIVNVFYPPQSIGGATRVVKDNVDVLTTQYKDTYEVSVFTTDEGNQQPYQIAEYTHEGVRVTKVSSPMVRGMDWQYKNPRMYEIFKSYLEIEQPDLIHFHCVQRLTASVLEAAANVGIPYLVTVHDAWWISDHQFLVNEEGVECNYQQNDPVVAAADANDITDSIRRKIYLREQLNRAAEVLAVSEAFSEIYRQNEFPQTKANRNGIQPRPVLPRKPSKSGKVRLAHIGGMAAHKGYFLFKEAVEKANLKNTEVIVINHAQSPGTVEYGDWNGVPVTFLAKFEQEEIYELYSMMDVLVAPSMWPESFGLVTREASAAGVWVIASDKGAIGEDIVPSQNGYIISVEHPSSLIEALQEIDIGAVSYLQSNQVCAQVRTAKSQVEELSSFYQKHFKSFLGKV